VNEEQLSHRQQQILQQLRSVEQGQSEMITSTMLTRRFDVSVQSIRKDLNLLSDLGLVKRVHGGITLPVKSHNLSFTNRQVINLQAKKAIARTVVATLPKGASIFLGIGTTPQQIAQELIHHPGLTVVTNNLNAGLVLCQNPNIVTYLSGGKIRPADQDVTGEDCTSFLRKFHVNFGIFGVGGIAENGALLDFSPEESHISSVIINNCDNCILVADKSKYLRSAPIKTAVISQVDKFYTDQLPQPLAATCHRLGVEVIECGQKEAI
jgi:DeoR family glycerol-3-phosphate regulon repressor